MSDSKYSFLYEKRPDGWWDALDKAALRYRSQRAIWERYEKEEMSFDEFMFRKDLTWRVNNDQMMPEDAMKYLEDFKKRED